MSTSVSRKAPPALPALMSRYATPAPPSLKRSASMVPGTLAGAPPNGVPSPDEDEATVSVAAATVTPNGPSTITVYVVVAEGETDIEPLAGTMPIEGVIVTFVEPLVLHE